MLDPDVIQRIFSIYGRPAVDLFASSRSKQVCPLFSTDRHSLYASPLHKLDSNSVGMSLPFQLIGDSSNTMVTHSPMVVRADQIVSPVTLHSQQYRFFKKNP